MLNLFYTLIFMPEFEMVIITTLNYRLETSRWDLK
jgi:hypothetical protein